MIVVGLLLNVVAFGLQKDAGMMVFFIALMVQAAFK
jgi:hypothetical protein